MKATLCYVLSACVTLAWAGYMAQGLNAHLARSQAQRAEAISELFHQP